MQWHSPGGLRLWGRRGLWCEKERGQNKFRVLPMHKA